MFVPISPKFLCSYNEIKMGAWLRFKISKDIAFQLSFLLSSVLAFFSSRGPLLHDEIYRIRIHIALKSSWLEWIKTPFTSAFPQLTLQMFLYVPGSPVGKLPS